MIERKTQHHLNSNEDRSIDKELIRKLRRLAEEHTVQYALLWYIYLSKGATLKQLHRVYCKLTGRGRLGEH